MFKLFRKLREEDLPQEKLGEDEATTREADKAESDKSEAEASGMEANNEADRALETEGEKAEEEREALMGRFREWMAKNLSDETARSSAEEAMGAVAEALAKGAGLEVLFEMVTKGADYDRAVTEAEALGEVKGREALIAEDEAMLRESDGVPHPGSGGNVYSAPSPSIFEVARGVW